MLGTWKLETDPTPAGSVAVEIKVGGLKGGHSGLEIDKGRGNAIKILNRAVGRVAAIGGRLARIDGGNKRNAIPRDAVALMFVPKAKVDEALKAVAAMNEICRAELPTVEPNLQVTAAASKVRAKVFKKGLQKKIMQVISALPHGVIKMSAEISWLVETSTNVAVITTSKKDVSLATSQRSSVASEIVEINDTVRTIFELAGATATGSDGYPGWKPNLDSPILKLAKSTPTRRSTARSPRSRPSTPAWSAGSSARSTPGWTWCRSARRSRACTRPTRRSTSTPSRSTGTS